MKLLIINGSPKKNLGNTSYYLSFFIEGFESINGNECIMEYIGNASCKKINIIKNKINECENTLFAFPVFYHSMPGNVRKMMENLDSYVINEKKFSFFIQQMYINSERSKMLIEHLKSFCGHINVSYNGTALKCAGPIASIFKKIQQSSFKKAFLNLLELVDEDFGKHLNFKKVTTDLKNLGIYFGKYGVFDDHFIQNYAKPLKMSKKSFIIHNFIAQNIYYKKLLKRNGSYDNRYDTPLQKYISKEDI
ncbi:MAG: hypothetical protein LBG21_07410 [Campylobacteraceae bacterium]|jgi:hypothetical protein|nr:hypothetical protein [Campylobacteraceae bacterium]